MTTSVRSILPAQLGSEWIVRVRLIDGSAARIVAGAILIAAVLAMAMIAHN